MTKKLIKTCVAYSIIIFSMIGCNKDLTDLNINPNESVTAPSLDLLFSPIMPGLMGNLIDSYRMPGQIVQQFANLNSEEGTLTYDDGQTSLAIWRDAFVENGGAFRNSGILIEEAMNQENEVYEAIGKIYRAYMMSPITDLFGDMPYSAAGQAFKVEEQYLLPKFDTQQEIYTSMINDLKEANTLLANADPNQVINADYDVILGGDRLKWRKFANSFRLRLLMRISEVVDVSADVAAIFGDPSGNPVISDIDDEPMFERNDPLGWTFDPTNNVNEDKRISATVVDIMKGLGGVNQVSTSQDPRLSFLLNPTENSVTNGTPEYVGQPVGVVQDLTDLEFRSTLSDEFSELNKWWLLTYAEVLYIKAEAAHRGMITGNASDLLISGIEASIERYGLDSGSTESVNYLAGVAADFSGNEMKHIGIQRWLDQLNSGYEGYSTWRRFDVPILTAGPDTVPEIPVRFPYSPKSTDKNNSAYLEALNRAPLNGNDFSNIRNWWDAN